MSPTSENPDKPEESAEATTGEPTEPAPGDGGDPGGNPGSNGDGGLLIEVDTSDSPAAKIAALEAKVATLTQEKKDLWDKFVRASADIENLRKRTRRDLDDAKHDAKTRVLKEMLPVADNLERALQHSGGGDATSVLEGVKLVLRQFTHAFERTEVNAVEAEGKPFDPNLHEAIGQQESELPPGTVVSVLQRGYKLGGKLLRPALVVVAKAKAPPAPTASEETTAEIPSEAPPETPAEIRDTSDVPEGGNG